MNFPSVMVLYEVVQGIPHGHRFVVYDVLDAARPAFAAKGLPIPSPSSAARVMITRRWVERLGTTGDHITVYQRRRC